MLFEKEKRYFNNFKKTTLLFLAAEKKSIPLCSCLLKHGANPNKNCECYCFFKKEFEKN